METYTIEVDVVVTRTYRVEADGPNHALMLYHAGDAEIDQQRSEMFEANWDEREYTARVLSLEYNSNGYC